MLLFVLVTTLVLSLYACAPTVPPKAGHYTGTNPDVSFDVTAKGVENFTITMTFSDTDTKCTLGPLDALNIKSDGSFSYQLTMQGSSKSVISVTGKINGDKVGGDYSAQICMADGQLEAFANQAEGKWTASLNGPVPTNTPIPTITPTSIPAKLGHYEGTNPSVSFDLVDAGSMALPKSLDKIGKRGSFSVQLQALTSNLLRRIQNGF